jgi:murein DD-endopeptidase MepM/ murein hydrolase activator NlpD
VNLGSFPKPHLILVCGLSLLMATVVLVDAIPSTDAAADATDPVETFETVDAVPAVSTPAVPVIAATASTPLADTPDAPGLNLHAASLVLSQPDPITVPLRIETPRSDKVTTVKVRSGDSLSIIFKREGLPAGDVHHLVTSEPLGKRLKNIYPGHELTFTQAEDGTLLKMAYTPSALQTLEFEKDDTGFKGRELVVQPDRNKAYKHGIIDHSLFVASQRAGLPDAMTMRLAQIFQWDVDFVLDIRRGDEFHVVYEELYVGDEFVGFGDILAAEFINQGRSHRAIRYTDARGDSDYYGPKGNPMRQAFIRAPVEFSRISSNFNLRRVHPLFKRSAPHRGIDYAAPTGTPVYAAGEGRVVTAGRTEPNGNYVVIQHGQAIVTKYLHLSKFGRGIRSGERVKQGQTIGYVGATGWATGPHLHYEFLVNGVHQNPRTVKLPNAEPIPAQELARFKQNSAPLLALLEDYKQQVHIALGR